MKLIVLSPSFGHAASDGQAPVAPGQRALWLDGGQHHRVGLVLE